MKLIIGGVRGTNPVSQPEFMQFGGETTSFLFEGVKGEKILIDAGTGIRTLGHRIEQDQQSASTLILMTHYHLDHIMGLPSLSLIYDERWSIQMASPIREGFNIQEIMPRLLAKPFWPLQVEQLESHVHFSTLEGDASKKPFSYGELEIRWCPLHHPGGSTAYRIDEPATGASCVIATDVEWPLSSPEFKDQFFKLCASPQPPSLLLFDGQYTPEEYPKYQGWGHSTWQDAIDVARGVGAKKLLITHHAPAKDDAQLARLEDHIKTVSNTAILAREKMEILIN